MKALIEFILFVFASGLIINGWYEVTRHGRVFEFWSKFWEHFTQVSDEFPAVHKFPKWVRSPISECPMCMSSIYGSIIFWSTYFWDGSDLNEYSLVKAAIIWIPYLLSLTCCSFLVHKLIGK